MIEETELTTALEELRVAEEELRAQNDELMAAQLAGDVERRRYEDLFYGAPVPYLVTDRNGKILEANDAVSRLLDVDRTLLVGKVLVSFVARRERRPFRRLLLSLLHASGIVESELRLGPLGGDELVVVAQVRPGESPHGDLELRWSLRDVTAERQGEVELRLLNDELESRVADRAEELARERARLEAVVEQIPVGLVMLDAETGHVELANAEAMRILGLPTDARDLIAELAAWEIFRLDGTRYDPADLPISRALDAGETAEGERVEIVTRDGRRVLLDVSSAPVRDPSGRVVGAVAAFYDVTERERLERAEREFVTNAAHELRTPLAAISSVVEVLQAGAKEVPEERDRFLSHIDRECDRLARLTTSLLSLARAQGGVEAPRVELIELCPLLEQLAAEARPAEAVAVEVDCPRDLVAVANPDLLEQALENVVANAARHTRRGSIVFAARADDGGKVVLEVRDTGRGMSADERERVTERFYRGSDGDGFGLGLAIAAEAARALGAELELDSALGRGTTARITLSSARLVAQ